MTGARSLLSLPRSVLLALWVQHAGSADTSLGRAARATQGDDEPHTVEGEAVLGSATETLLELLAAWTGPDLETVAVLPAPGDPMGVPAPATSRALDAGECVLVRTSTGAWAASPHVETFGSELEPGHLVSWHVDAVPDWRLPVAASVGTLAEAERDLRTALLHATQAIASLDVARWRPDAAEAIASVRSGVGVSSPLPPGLPGRRVQVLVTSARLRAIVALATADDGGAVNLWQADQRSTALREIDRSARRAMSAATLASPT